MDNSDIDKWNMLGDKYWMNRKNKQKWAHTYVLFPAIESILRSISFSSFLDFGCGDGMLLHTLSSRFTGVKFYGYDKSEIMLTISKKLHPSIGFLDTIEGMNFDVVCLNMVFQDISKPAEVLRELKNVVNNCGIVIVTVPHPVFSLIESQHLTTKREVVNPSGKEGIYRYIYEETEKVYWNSEMSFWTSLYNRTLTTYSKIFKKLNMCITGIYEPLAIQGGKVESELYMLHRNIPKYLIFVLADLNDKRG